MIALSRRRAAREARAIVEAAIANAAARAEAGR